MARVSGDAASDARRVSPPLGVVIRRAAPNAGAEPSDARRPAFVGGVIVGGCARQRAAALFGDCSRDDTAAPPCCALVVDERREGEERAAAAPTRLVLLAVVDDDDDGDDLDGDAAVVVVEAAAAVAVEIALLTGNEPRRRESASVVEAALCGNDDRLVSVAPFAAASDVEFVVDALRVLSASEPMRNGGRFVSEDRLSAATVAALVDGGDIVVFMTTIHANFKLAIAAVDDFGARYIAQMSRQSNAPHTILALSLVLEGFCSATIVG